LRCKVIGFSVGEDLNGTGAKWIERNKAMKEFSKENLLGFYRSMVRIRKVEEKLMEVFAKGEIPGFIHVCIGQEATPVAVCSHLQDSDYMSTTHRGHGHALAKGIDLKLFMAELFGRSNGVCMGRSGSMHVADRSKGILGANGIVGAGIPIATGAAFAAKYERTGRVVVCFFGDGASNQGTFHESLNIASLKKLPIVYVCENNQWAQFTPQALHMPVEDVACRAESYAIPGVTVVNDFFEIYKVAGEAIKRAKKSGGPTLIEVQCNRWYGHYVGDPQKYRSEDTIRSARQDDCIRKFEETLLKDDVVRKQEIDKIAEEIQGELEEAIEFARNSPIPDGADLCRGLYV
jgi:acetoin:2,6-dichlorophenolindophenol oxidoreductase subunit alpha